jgi:hypothetical protein
LLALEAAPGHAQHRRAALAQALGDDTEHLTAPAAARTDQAELHGIGLFRHRGRSDASDARRNA